jgi:glycosyltransferase involved in cell wall biosynthesis
LGKIKILRILHRASVSGPTHHASILQEKLNDEYFESKLLVGEIDSNEENGEYILKNRNIDYRILPFSRGLNLFNELKSILSIIKIIKKFKPDIVHTHASKPGFLGRIIAYILGVKVIIHTFHGHVFHSYFNSVISKLVILTERSLGLFTDKIIVISKKQKNEIDYFLKLPYKTKVIPLGLDLAKFKNIDTNIRNSFRKEFGVKNNEFCIGIVGRLTGVKDHKLFINIANLILNKSNFKFKFLIIGGGELENELKLYVRNNLDPKFRKNIVFTGWVKEMRKVYFGIDCLFLTSKNEGTPVSIIEAISASLPVFSTNVGGVEDIFNKCKQGFLINSRSPEDFTNIFLSEFSGIKKNSRRIYNKYVYENYGFERLVNDIKKLYRNLYKLKFNE